MSRDGSLVAASGLDQLVRVWNAETGDTVCTLHANDAIRSVAFSSDGSRVIAGTENRLLMVWSLSGSEVRTIHQATQKGASTCVAFGERGQLIGAVYNSRAFVWDSHSGKQIFSADTGRFSRIALSPKQSWIAGAPTAKLVEVHTNREVQQFASSIKDTSVTPYGCAISNDESLVALADGHESVAIYSAATGDLVQSKKMRRWVSSVAISPDAKLFAAGSGELGDVFNRGTILVWEIASGRTVFEENLPLDVWWLSFSPNGHLLAAATGMYQNKGSIMGRIQIWRTADWQKVFDLQGHRSCLWSLDFNPSGTRLASAGGAHINWSPGELKIWDTATGEELFTIAAEKGPINGVAFSPDGIHLATAGGDGSVKIWNGTPLAETPTYEPLTAD